jgi:pyridinium-3,5-biscarboxylic acid mononucleotide sulfurtransferase
MLRPVVGFDLDLTLVDPRAGVAASYRELSGRTGVPIDADEVATRVGPQLELELARWFPAPEVPRVADTYREIFAVHGVPATTVLPGAAAALAEVRRQGGRSVVITAKSEPLARATLDGLGLAPDELVAWRWADGKTRALTEIGADLYVGDHVADMRAAHAAGVRAIGVTSGADGADALTEAGADVVLASVAEFPAWLSAYLLPARLAALDAALGELGSVVVAFSGGADSAFVLAAATRALGPDNVVAATAVSPSLAARELGQAADFAARLGVRHETPRTDEMAREGYRANDGNRCFFCKAELLDVLRSLADSLGIAHVATGTNADDAIAGFRPGIRAAAERGALTPLRDAGFTKDQVRAASREWGLATWDKPALACLSSRVAYGVAITPQRLARVEQAEVALRAALATAGAMVRDLRVRDLGDRARIEVDADVVDWLIARPELLQSVGGFEAVEVDPRGFRSGSMNDALVHD